MGRLPLGLLLLQPGGADFLGGDGQRAEPDAYGVGDGVGDRGPGTVRGDLGDGLGAEAKKRANRTIRLSGGIVVEDDVNERA